MAELIDRDVLLKKTVTIPGPSGKSVFSVVFTDDILNAETIGPTIKNDLAVLDKVRAELEHGKTGLDIEFNGGIDYALSIIDKHMAEGRVKDESKDNNHS